MIKKNFILEFILVVHSEFITGDIKKSFGDENVMNKI